MSAPPTKAARQNLIIDLVGGQAIRSQSELSELLGAQGIEVSQGTLSKDLLEVGAMRVRASDGQLIYAVPGEGGDRSARAAESPAFEKRLTRVLGELLVSAEGSANLAVLRTPPGAAQYVASAVDKVGWSAILGTIAGDDTVMVITREPDGGPAMAQRFLTLDMHDHAPEV